MEEGAFASSISSADSIPKCRIPLKILPTFIVTFILFGLLFRLSVNIVSMYYAKQGSEQIHEIYEKIDNESVELHIVPGSRKIRVSIKLCLRTKYRVFRTSQMMRRRGGRNNSFGCRFQRKIRDCGTLMLKWQEENVCAGFAGAHRSGIIKNHTQHCCWLLEPLTVRVRLSSRDVVQFSNLVLARINLNLQNSKGTLQTDLVDVFIKWFLF